MSDTRPDIIVIMVDDMGYSDLGCYGGEIDTPNIDSLAANGVRFTQFYNCARCCPTRASLLTGLYPHRAGIGHMTHQTQVAMNQTRAVARGPYQGYLSKNTVTIAEALRTAGYQTFMSGKWHVGSFRPNWPKDRGFDHYYGILSGACNYWAPEGDRGLMDEDTPVTDLPENFYTTDAFSQRAVDYVDGADPDRPYFLHLMYNAPHWPLHAWPEDIAKYKGKYKIGWDEIRERRAAKQKELGLFPDDLPLSPRDPECPPWDQIDSVPDMQGKTYTEDEWDHRMAVYAAMIDRVDQGIGKLLDKIREKRDLDNTVIMFLADNGACAESHDPVPDVPAGPRESDTACFLPWANASNTPFRLFKHWLHEGGSATPFIFHWPNGIEEGRIETGYYAHVKESVGPGQSTTITPACPGAPARGHSNQSKAVNVRPIQTESQLHRPPHISNPLPVPPNGPVHHIARERPTRFLRESVQNLPLRVTHLDANLTVTSIRVDFQTSRFIR
jgi:arylsulfatase